MTSTISKNLNMEVAGFIGITALAQMTISIDYRDGLIKFAYDANRGFRVRISLQIVQGYLYPQRALIRSRRAFVQVWLLRRREDRLRRSGLERSR